jgi:hypothetical protein
MFFISGGRSESLLLFYRHPVGTYNRLHFVMIAELKLIIVAGC